MISFKQYWNHFVTISKHKWYVFKACKDCGIIWRGITHDLSKYSLKEFISSAQYFQGDRSPIAKEKEVKGYSYAWLHHKGRNRHHWQYWVDFDKQYGRPYAVKMPYKDMIEMICDWIGAGKAYAQGKWTERYPLEYWWKTKSGIILHPETYKFVSATFYDIAEYGWETAVRNLKRRLIFY